MYFLFENLRQSYQKSSIFGGARKSSEHIIFAWEFNSRNRVVFLLFIRKKKGKQKAGNLAENRTISFGPKNHPKWQSYNKDSTAEIGVRFVFVLKTARKLKAIRLTNQKFSFVRKTSDMTISTIRTQQQKSGCIFLCEKDKKIKAIRPKIENVRLSPKNLQNYFCL